MNDYSTLRTMQAAESLVRRVGYAEYRRLMDELSALATRRADPDTGHLRQEPVEEER